MAAICGENFDQGRIKVKHTYKHIQSLQACKSPWWLFGPLHTRIPSKIVDTDLTEFLE
jgi:hypothetical protein